MSPLSSVCHQFVTLGSLALLLATLVGCQSAGKIIDGPVAPQSAEGCVEGDYQFSYIGARPLCGDATEPRRRGY
jgi:hypothetical protein